MRFTIPDIGWHEGGAGQIRVSPETHNTVLQISKYWETLLYIPISYVKIWYITHFNVMTWGQASFHWGGGGVLGKS